MQIFKVLIIPVLGLAVLVCYPSGTWGHKVCGTLDSNNVKAIPWVANIYQINENGGHEFICSGTVVARKIILTAARCFYNDLTLKLKNRNYTISVGQKYKAWSVNGENVQLREISQENVILPDRYNGIATNYSNNIAIVKLHPKQKLTINAFTSRACVYWDNDFRDSELEVNTPPLKVIAWQNGDNATLVMLEPSFINFELCQSFVPQDFHAFLTVDKMCVQLQDSSLKPSIGSGLYAYNKAKGQWYLIGITSEITSADHKTYVSFVKINVHLNWLSNTAFLHVE